MVKLQSHIKMPKRRRSADEPKEAELKAFQAYQNAYRRVYGCSLTLTYFDPASRVATFKGPVYTTAATARRCKELTKQLKFREQPNE